ncbi:MAG: GIY-YIG nuclease family protein [Candidatus Cloacimonetes bacterium]|nr:GIY-YIG nuclease family protein [Candidatus Cloacimonadota bacterium]
MNYNWAEIKAKKDKFSNSGVYCIVNEINNKKYIGISINIYNRIYEHLSRYKKGNRNYAIYLAFNKYGLNNFKVKILEFCMKEKLVDKEKHYIEKFNTYKGIGYNMTPGGEITGVGEDAISAVLSQSIADKIRKEYNNSEENIYTLAEKYEVGHCTINDILNSVRYMDSQFAKNYKRNKNKTNGSNNGNSCFNKRQVKEIRKLYKQGIKQNIIADKFDTTPANINSVCLNQTYYNENYKPLTTKEKRLLKNDITIKEIEMVAEKHNKGESWLSLSKEYNPSRKTLKKLVNDYVV